MIDEPSVSLFAHTQLVVANETTSLLLVSEIQPMPVKYRAAAEYQSNSLNVVQREVVDGLQPLAGAWGQRGGAWSPSRGILRRGQFPEWVEVASLGLGFRSDRVPKKIPSVRPRTVNCAPLAPLEASRSTGMIPMRRYQKFCFIV